MRSLFICHSLYLHFYFRNFLPMNEAPYSFFTWSNQIPVCILDICAPFHHPIPFFFCSFLFFPFTLVWIFFFAILLVWPSLYWLVYLYAREIKDFRCFLVMPESVYMYASISFAPLWLFLSLSVYKFCCSICQSFFFSRGSGFSQFCVFFCVYVVCSPLINILLKHEYRISDCGRNANWAWKGREIETKCGNARNNNKKPAHRLWHSLNFQYLPFSDPFEAIVNNGISQKKTPSQWRI